MHSLGMIGFGAIGRTVLEKWAERPCPGFRITALLVRSYQIDAAKAACAQLSSIPGPLVTDNPADFHEARCDLVVEAAGQAALRDNAAPLLRSGCDLMIISTGALADAAFRRKVRILAEDAGRRIIIPSGALAGFDGLSSLRQAGLESVTYRSSKPPSAWKGTEAESRIDLDRIEQPACFFRGSAGDAALRFPKNANLAATVALAGLGFDATQVELIADPTLSVNVGRVIAVSTSGSMDLTVSGLSMPDNPKTSSITAMSIISAIDRQTAPFRFV